MCETLHCLPYAGGLFNQPGYAVIRMEKIIIADEEIAEAERNKEESKSKAEDTLDERLSGAKS